MVYLDHQLVRYITSQCGRSSKSSRVYIRRSEELLKYHIHPPHHLRQQKVLPRGVQCTVACLVPSFGGRESKTGRRRARRSGLKSMCRAEGGNGRIQRSGGSVCPGYRGEKWGSRCRSRAYERMKRPCGGHF